MPERRIAGSPGSEPERQPDPNAVVGQPAAGGAAGTPAVATAKPATPATARVVIEAGVAFVEVDGRRARLSDADLARLRGTEAASEAPAIDESVPADFARAIASAWANRSMLLQIPNVISVRAGYKFVDGRITKTPAVVVGVDRKVDAASLTTLVPTELPDGVSTDVTVADPLDRLEAAGVGVPAPIREPLLIEQVQVPRVETEALEAVPIITYHPSAGASLAPVTGPMVVTCHASPDAGWAVLRPFLEETRRSMTLGMYDFTAPHLYRSIRSLLRDSDVTWRQTLDRKISLPDADDIDSTKAEDKTEESVNRGLERVARDRFETAFARTGSGKTFASAYHIKVAVRDDVALWLSSGNWQSSNQPAIDFLDGTADRRLMVRYNREWHMVVESAELAATFQRYLNGDFETALSGPEAALEAAIPAGPDLVVEVDELFEAELEAASLQAFPAERFVFTDQDPLTVQPILTPDNYLDTVLPLLRQRPARTLYFQNQSLNPIQSPTPRWRELLGLLAEYSQDMNLDVRIIFRNIGPIRKKVESLQLAGFNMDRVRMQAGCHNKGLVIDGRTVLLGSHNWTNQGVEANRDASLLIENEEIAAYYERIFLHDWEHLAKPTIREEATPRLAGEGSEAAGGDGQLLPWSGWLEE